MPSKNDDFAQKETDKELYKLEKKIEAVYRDASQDMQKKIDQFFSAFEAQDKEKQELLKLGKITKEQYISWRMQNFTKGGRYITMRDAFAERMVKADQVAAAYINDTTPGIYSLNYNFSAYDIEKACGNLGFVLYDEQTIKRLIEKSPSLLPYYPQKAAIKPGIDLAWTKKKILEQITSGILQGEGTMTIAKNLRTAIPGMSKSSSIRTARTAITSAQNGGRQESYEKAAKMGINVKKVWVATKDSRTRDAHQKLDGKTADWDEPFLSELGEIRYPGDPRAKPANVYNCFVGDVKVASDSKLIRSYKHIYEGDLITVKTAGGVQFTCTPNHPILTPNGWVSAELLNNGDNILVTFGEQNVFGGVNPDIKHRFPRIDAIHNLFNVSGGERAVGVSVNFHGDVATSNVEIVSQKRFLRRRWYSGIGKSVDKILFKLSDKTFARKRSFVEHFRRICASSFGFMRSRCKALSFLWRRLTHSNVHGFRPSTDMNVVLPEYSIDNLPAETVIRSELLDGLSGKVFFDKIVSVEVSSANCHVYNLQTQNGYYFVNSSIPQSAGRCNGIFAIAKNCRCTMRTEVPKNLEAEPRKMRVRDPKTGKNVVVNEMTYAEWEEWVKSRE